MAAGLKSFDFVLEDDGMVHPETGEIFVQPVGLSLRPEVVIHWVILWLITRKKLG